MEKKLGAVKRFFEEFKKFITRGNVLDMSVGVIVGGAFTAIVNGLSNFILKPIVNWLIALFMGDKGRESAVTILSPAYGADGALDLANSIYIDWGSFVSAIINFLIIAFVLFTIVKIINRVAEAQTKAIADMIANDKKELRKIRRENKVSKKQALAMLEERKAQALAEKAAAEQAQAELAATQAAAEAEKAMANTRLLQEIRDLLKNK